MLYLQRMKKLSRRFCIAPMMDWSDRHCRYFWRLLSNNALLYTEMITTGALLHGDTEYHLAFHPHEHPIAVQLGGNKPADLAKAAKLCEKNGYDEVNLNVGCPSDRVKSGAFGAYLMNQPQLVADSIKAMQDATSLPVTIKCRIGVDDNDSYQALTEFVDINQCAGCTVFIVHARKAWLSGLSPKQNREIPPLDYPTVFRLKQDFPQLEIILNGGLKSLESCQDALQTLDGVMMGREAYQNPYLLNRVDQQLFDGLKPAFSSPVELAHRYAHYIEDQLIRGVQLNYMTRHLLGLFNGQPGARAYRRYLSENATRSGAGVEVFLTAVDLLHSGENSASKLESLNRL